MLSGSIRKTLWWLMLSTNHRNKCVCLQLGTFFKSPNVYVQHWSVKHDSPVMEAMFFCSMQTIKTSVCFLNISLIAKSIMKKRIHTKVHQSMVLEIKNNVYSTTTKKYIFDVDSTMAFPLECSHKVNLYLKQGLSSAHSNAWKQFSLNFITFDRIHTIYIVFQSCKHYSVPWVLMTDARPFHAFAAILDWLTHLASISCWHWFDARQDEFSCFIVNFKSTRLWSCRRRWSASKKNTTPSYKPTKHIKYTFLICDCYCSSYMYIVMLLT